MVTGRRMASRVPKRWPRGRGVRAVVALAAACGVIAVLSGCAARVTGAPLLAVTSAYVPLPTSSAPGTTVAFLDIRNDGGADRLVAARTSAGGKVVFRAPSGTGTAMKTIPELSIPAKTTVRLIPDDAHLLITDVGHLRAGKDITLVLTFARAGTVSVTARVTDPQTGSTGFFSN